MDKPLSVMINETKDNIRDIIVNSGVPMSLMELIISDTYNEIKDTAQLQYRADLIGYTRELSKSKESDTTK